MSHERPEPEAPYWPYEEAAGRQMLSDLVPTGLRRYRKPRLEIQTKLDSIQSGLSARVRLAAMPNYLQMIRTELRLADELPLRLAVVRLETAILRAERCLLQAQELAGQFENRSVESWLKGVEVGLRLARPLPPEPACLTDPVALAALRAKDVPTHHVRPAPSDETISQRVMRKVRVAVYLVIAPAVRRYCGERDLQWAGRALPERSAAFTLTAAYIRAAFPIWGRSTTPESVRKAVRARWRKSQRNGK